MDIITHFRSLSWGDWIDDEWNDEINKFVEYMNWSDSQKEVLISALHAARHEFEPGYERYYILAAAVSICLVIFEDQILEDAIDSTAALIDKFKEKKVILFGHTLHRWSEAPYGKIIHFLFYAESSSFTFMFSRLGIQL